MNDEKTDNKADSVRVNIGAASFGWGDHARCF